MAVADENGRSLERRGEERSSRVSLLVIDTNQRGDVRQVGVGFREDELHDVGGSPAGQPKDGIERLRRHRARIQPSRTHAREALLFAERRQRSVNAGSD
jgi:hypothetical protein